MSPAAEQFSAAAVARALGGEVVGRNRVLAPGPNHSAKDRSLSVRIDPSAPGGFIVNSFADDDPMTCRDLVRSRLGLPGWGPERREPLPLSKPAKVDEDEARREAWLQDRVAALWRECLDPRGTIVERYLRSRELVLDEAAAGALRFHPDCPWREEDGRTVRVPAMIAALRCIHTDRLRAVHRTRLTPEGLKVDRRALGDAAGTAVKLDPDEVVTTGLAIGEGVETTLAGRQMGLRPAWSVWSVSQIASFPVLAGIDCLMLFREDDTTGANAKACQTCAERWHEAGREVIFAKPRTGGDLNDALREVRR